MLTHHLFMTNSQKQTHCVLLMKSNMLNIESFNTLQPKIVILYTKVKVSFGSDRFVDPKWSLELLISTMVWLKGSLEKCGSGCHWAHEDLCLEQGIGINGQDDDPLSLALKILHPVLDRKSQELSKLILVYIICKLGPNLCSTKVLKQYCYWDHHTERAMLCSSVS